ncbi:MocR-like pyridoxine biosynthesis transcription factor PdxR [Piscinibacter terrae]|uniref:PLP-dependent aminotransferase family protein n=1 Tax=Piscinibacter terrae TaxID=2496871 RepID=A0A3N7IR43_9BURK|nr:PLP-dependent aminotransferase family protein [Albitalea terrae]RQP21352.1 PLP-dependent aminotransferase family protein [Albitalea terrae]
MIDLALLLKPKLAHGNTGTLRRQLCDALKAAVLDGTLKAGSVLPASRVLARELRCGRNTVLHAYEELATEGYVLADRQGTVVSHLPAAARHASSRAAASALPPLSRRGTPHRPGPDGHAENQAPFMPGEPALEEFPLARWQRRIVQAWKSVDTGTLSGNPSSGEPVLRAAIAAYLHASRGVHCDAEQVVITSGTSESLALCAHLLAERGERVWMEHPGYMGARAAFMDAGLSLVPVPVDAHGIAPPDALWKRSPPRLVYATPSHQYPLGVVLSLPRRLSLIENARSAGAWVLEDDYDSEFCRGVPLAAMHGLAPDAPVIYMGTFSKTLFPALRLGFMVLPQAALPQVLPALGRRLVLGRPADQEALAAFIQEGDYTSHLRRMRGLYAEREHALREALERHWPLPLMLSPGHGGMHLALALPQAVPDQAVVQAAWRAGLAPRALSNYAVGHARPLNGLVLGYGRLASEDADRCVRELAAVVKATAGAQARTS